MKKKSNVDRVFDLWIKFMNVYGPTGKKKEHVNGDESVEFRRRMQEELKKLEEDQDSFFMGGGMS